MLFSLEADQGEAIILYFVPDSFADIPTVRIAVAGREDVEFAANEDRQALVAGGRHESGRCGFRIDAAVVPDIAAIEELSIFDKATGLLIYRRTARPCVARKIIRLETSYLSKFALDRSLSSLFRFAAERVDRYGQETVTQLLLMAHSPSTFLSGRILYKNYAFFIEDNYELIIDLEDPYVLLAERMMVLAKLHMNHSLHVLGERDAMLLRNAAAFCAELRFGDGKSLRNSLRNLPQEIAVGVVNPVVRQLTAGTPDEMPRRGAVAATLDVLSGCAIVGIRQNVEQFKHGVEALLGTGELPVTTPIAEVSVVADLLRQEAQVEALIDSDLEVYTQVKDALEKL